MDRYPNGTGPISPAFGFPINVPGLLADFRSVAHYERVFLTAFHLVSARHIQ